ncbi:hypothetical protein [Minwuia sp.]|uniref:hypothetical protein n=1 Tax=Minwuia sp. TaxID=2493630 RepID=UPI003A907902
MIRYALVFLGAVMLTTTAAVPSDVPESGQNQPTPTVSGNDQGGYPVGVAVRMIAGAPKYFVRYSREEIDFSKLAAYAIEMDLTRAVYERNIEQYGDESPGIMTNLCPGAHAMAEDGDREYWIVVWVDKDNTLMPCLPAP